MHKYHSLLNDISNTKTSIFFNTSVNLNIDDRVETSIFIELTMYRPHLYPWTDSFARLWADGSALCHGLFDIRDALMFNELKTLNHTLIFSINIPVAIANFLSWPGWYTLSADLFESMHSLQYLLLLLEILMGLGLLSYHYVTESLYLQFLSNFIRYGASAMISLCVFIGNWVSKISVFYCNA